MKKINSIHYFLLITILMLFGCSEEFLNEEPNDRIDLESFYSSPEEAEIGLTGAYSRVVSQGIMQLIFYWVVSSDEVTAASHANSGIGSGDHRELSTASLFGMGGTYYEPYKGIANINLLLEKVPDIPDTDFAGNRKNEILGEAYFLRGFAYYMLAMGYRDVPIVLESPTSSNPNDNFMAKEMQDAVLDQALEDFDMAISLLPNKLENMSDHDVRGRASKWAAKGFKACIYLWREQWDSVNSECDDILNSGQFVITPNWIDIFKSEYGGENDNEEVIWQSQGQSREEYDFIGVYRWYSDDAAEQTLGPFMAESSVLSSFEEPYKDVRLEYSVRRIGESGGYAGRNVKHFHVPSGYIEEGVSDESRDKNYPLIRLAEIKLMKAEAIVQSNYTLGTKDEVLDILNELRARAEDTDFDPCTRELDCDDDRYSGTGGCTGIEPLTIDDVNLQAVKDEKRRELVFERGIRWIDQLRWDKENGYQNVMSMVNAEEEGKLYLAIPQSAIDANDGVLVQNPAY